MASQPFATRPDYVKSVAGLRQLHELTLAGKDETLEAETIRDALEPLWWKLTKVEQDRINGLSEDLYSISDPHHQVVSSNPQAQKNLVLAIDSHYHGDWDKALEILRRWAKYVEPPLLASLRGSIWRAAGDSVTATLFFGRASELDDSEFRSKFNISSHSKMPMQFLL